MYIMRPDGSTLRSGLIAFIATLPDRLTMAEIGCYAGESTLLFLDKAAYILAVDPWTDYVEKNETGGWVPMAHMDSIEREFDALVDVAGGRISKRKGSSVEIAATIADQSLDLVYIDANHEYTDMCADLVAWLPKVKPGGLIAGHDYVIEYLGVIRAVHERLGEPDAVFGDTTWVKRVPPGPKAQGPAPRLSQDRQKSPRVLIGIPCQERGSFSPFDACVDQLTEGRTDTRVYRAMGSVVPGARNRIVREALRTGADYIWFLDNDQPFFAGDPANPSKVNDLDRLLAHNLDAVVPLSPRRAAPFHPLLHSAIHPTESFVVQRFLLPDDHGLVEVASAGLSGLLIKTAVFLTIGLDGWFEFAHPSNDFDAYAEDIPFYRRLQAAGVQLYCDLDCRFGHAVTVVAYIVYRDGQWMTVLADQTPFVLLPQPQHPLGISYSEKQRRPVLV